MVRSMGITHIELAEHLDAIRKLLMDNNGFCGGAHSSLDDELKSMSENLYSRPREKGYGFPSLSEVVFYDPNSLKNNTIGKGTQTQMLLACKSGSFGVQHDIFVKYKGSWRGQHHENLVPSDGAWSGNIEIINPINGVRLTVGDGVIDYIRKYGFYEGRGDDGHNPYRVDPVDIIAILTGKSPSSIRKICSIPAV